MSLVALAAPSISGNLVTIPWTYTPDAAVKLTGFKAYWKQPAATAWNSVTLGPDARSYTITGVPGVTDEVHVDATVEAAAEHSDTTTFTLPVAPVVDTHAPVLSVVQQTATAAVLTWPALSGQTDYEVATVRNPATTRDTAYQVVKGSTQVSLPAVPGQTVNYGCRGTAEGSAWAKEVAISWPSSEPTPTPTPTPTPGKLVTGLNAGGWGPSELADIPGVAQAIRVENASDETISTYASHNLGVVDLTGHYSTSGVAAVSASAVVANAVARVKAHKNIVAAEALNEPQNTYFWGPGAESQSNIEAYAKVINLMADQFVANGLTVPILWSADGGFRGVPTWGAKVWPLLNANAKQLGRPTVHPYGGVGARAGSALGNRARVEEAHTLTKLPVWVTEVGWPTATGQPSTGDSLQWSEAEQAANIQHFYEWAVAYQGVGAIAYFNFRDYSTNMWYGCESHEGRKKPAYTTLKDLTARFG